MRRQKLSPTTLPRAKTFSTLRLYSAHLFLPVLGVRVILCSSFGSFLKRAALITSVLGRESEVSNQNDALGHLGNPSLGSGGFL